MIISNYRINLYNDDTYQYLMNITLDNIFTMYGVTGMFLKAESYANKKSDSMPARRTSLGIYCISCEMLTCIEHFKKTEHKITNNIDTTIFYNNIEKYDYYYFMANLRLYVDSINNMSRFFNCNFTNEAYTALVNASAIELEKNEQLFNTIDLYNTNSSVNENYSLLVKKIDKKEDRNPSRIVDFLPRVISDITEQYFNNQKMVPKEEK